MSENAVAPQVVDAAFRVHTRLGPGLLESVFKAALAYELEKRRSASLASKASRWSTKRLGLLINFNVVLIKNGITRIVNGLKE